VTAATYRKTYYRFALQASDSIRLKRSTDQYQLIKTDFTYTAAAMEQSMKYHTEY